MKHLLASATALSFIATAAHAHDTEASDRTDVVQHEFSGFDAIDVSGVYELDVRIGEAFSVRTEANEESAEWRDVTMDGTTLKLGSRKNSRRWNTDDGHNSSVLAIVTLPRLVSLDVAGVATGEISAFKGGDIDVDIAGVSDLTLSGTCDTLEIDLAGVGDVNARALECETVDADIGGIGELSVYASKTITADAGGIGEINVYGNPDVRDTSGGFMAKVRIR